jgi:hypothetical protein
MISLGKEHAAKLFPYLTEDEVEQLTLSISSMRRIDPELKDAIVSEFLEICMAQKFISEGGVDYARELLEQAFGPAHANDISAGFLPLCAYARSTSYGAPIPRRFTIFCRTSIRRQSPLSYHTSTPNRPRPYYPCCLLKNRSTSSRV